MLSDSAVVITLDEGDPGGTAGDPPNGEAATG